MDHTQSQEQKILAHLQSGKTITSLEALNMFGCFRLGSRIHHLRSQGHKIVSIPITIPSTKKKVAQYSLIIPS